MTDAAFKNVFDQLILERGGRASLSVVHLSVVRSLALALCADPPASPATIAGLGALLPPPKKADEYTYDLRILSNTELRQLEFLTARAAGLKPAKLPRIRRSRREEDALEFAQFLDAIARRDKKPTDAGEFQIRKYPKLTDAEEIQIRNHIHCVLRDAADPNQLYSYLAWRAAPAAAAPPVTALPATAEPEASSVAVTTDNVVALNKPKSIQNNAPLADHSREPWRNDGVRRGFFGDNNQ